MCGLAGAFRGLSRLFLRRARATAVPRIAMSRSHSGDGCFFGPRASMTARWASTSWQRGAWLLALLLLGALHVRAGRDIVRVQRSDGVPLDPALRATLQELMARLGLTL